MAWLWFRFIIGSLALVGYVCEPLAEAAHAETYPPPGQLVDVGGYRLHIHCTGTGSPTVISVAGAGGWSTTWGGVVQLEVAKTTRVCTYDRAGLGWTEPGSLGGMVARIFAHEYAAEVLGVVLIDWMNPKQVTESQSNSGAQQLSFQAVLARLGIARLLVKLGIFPGYRMQPTILNIFAHNLCEPVLRNMQGRQLPQLKRLP